MEENYDLENLPGCEDAIKEQELKDSTNYCEPLRTAKYNPTIFEHEDFYGKKDKLVLSPIPDFTVGKIYNIYKEFLSETIFPIPVSGDGVSCIVKNDLEQFVKVSSAYFQCVSKEELELRSGDYLLGSQILSQNSMYFGRPVSCFGHKDSFLTKLSDLEHQLETIQESVKQLKELYKRKGEC